MKAVLALIVTVALLSSLAQAGLFNFGTMQQSQLIVVEPGGSAVGKIYVFNIHGDRATHVKAGISQALPRGFTAKILPEPRVVQYNISGLIMTSEENLVVELVDIKTLPKQKPETEEEGTEWITMGSVDGFVPAKVLLVKITADKSLPLWAEYNLTVNAVANWFDVGSGGPVSLAQARDFKFTVRTVTSHYSEERVLASPSPSPTAQATTAPQQKTEEQNLWFYSTLALVALVVLLFAYQFLRKPARR